MKKKSLVLAVVATLVLSMAGCGASAKDYEKDLEAFEEIAEFDWDDPDDMADDLDDLRFVTKEGKKFKKTFGEMIDMACEIYEIMEEEDDYDKIEKKVEKFEKKGEKLTEDLADILKDFCKAAEDAGVDEEDLEEVMDGIDF